jgi:hypothetical protein
VPCFSQYQLFVLRDILSAFHNCKYRLCQWIISDFYLMGDLQCVHSRQTWSLNCGAELVLQALLFEHMARPSGLATVCICTAGRRIIYICTVVRESAIKVDKTAGSGAVSSSARALPSDQRCARAAEVSKSNANVLDDILAGFRCAKGSDQIKPVFSYCCSKFAGRRVGLR